MFCQTNRNRVALASLKVGFCENLIIEQKSHLKSNNASPFSSGGQKESGPCSAALGSTRLKSRLRGCVFDRLPLSRLHFVALVFSPVKHHLDTLAYPPCFAR